MKLKIMSVGFVYLLFLISLSLLVSAEPYVVSSDSYLITEERIELDGYEDCLKDLEYENLMNQCLTEHNECYVFSRCLRENDLGEAGCSFKDGIPDCGYCLDEWHEEKDCIRENREKYEYGEDEAYCYGGPQGGYRTISSHVRNNCEDLVRITTRNHAFPDDTVQAIASGPSSPVQMCPTAIGPRCITSTKSYFTNITYVFGDYKLTINEPKEYEEEVCTPVNEQYGGDDCQEIINTIVTGEPIVSGQVREAGGLIKRSTCDKCPSPCSIGQPIGLEEASHIFEGGNKEATISCEEYPSLCSGDGRPGSSIKCGTCECPQDLGILGICDNIGLRDSINDIEAYCIDELWFEQKQDNQACDNNFECTSNFCSEGLCYDISAQVEENKGLLEKIWEFLFGWLE